MERDIYIDNQLRIIALRVRALYDLREEKRNERDLVRRTRNLLFEKKEIERGSSFLSHRYIEGLEIRVYHTPAILNSKSEGHQYFEQHTREEKESILKKGYINGNFSYLILKRNNNV